MKPSPALSVIITTLNARPVVRACLESLRADLERAGVPYEIIVVDDASADGSAEFVASRFPDVVLVRSAETIGYTRANNAGLRLAKGNMIFLLNADTVVQPGCIAALIGALDRHPRAGVVGPTLLNSDGTIQRSCWRFPLRSLIGNSAWLFRLGVWDDYRAWHHAVDREVDWISSAAWLFRRATLDTIGLLDERFWVYGVDIDWALRARRRRFGFVSSATARVMHHGGAPKTPASGRRYEDHMRSQALLFRLHYGPLGLVFFRATLLADSVARVLVWGVPSLLGFAPAKVKFAEFAHLAAWSIRGGAIRTASVPSAPPRSSR